MKCVDEDALRGVYFWPVLCVNGHALWYSCKHLKGPIARLGSRARETLCVAGPEVICKIEFLHSGAERAPQNNDWMRDCPQSHHHNPRYALNTA